MNILIASWLLRFITENVLPTGMNFRLLYVYIRRNHYSILCKFEFAIEWKKISLNKSISVMRYI